MEEEEKDLIDNESSGEEDEDDKKKRKKSLIHERVSEQSIVFVSLDKETGGPKCGIVQLSAILFSITGFSMNSINDYKFIEWKIH